MNSLARLFAIKQAWVFSLTYFIVCNIPSVLNRIFIYQSKSSLLFLELTKDSIAIAFFTYLLFVGLSINRVLFVICSFLLFVSGAIFAYYLQMSKIQPTLKVITAMIDFETDNALELIDIKIFIWTVFVICIWLFLIIKHSFRPKTRFDQLISLLFLIAVTINITALQYKVFRQYFPSQYLIEVNNYIAGKLSKSSSKFDISSLDFTDHSGKEIDVVLIIGESARFDRFGINGHTKQTSPKLAGMDNLQKFKSITCDSVTHMAVPCLLTRDFLKEKIDIDETSFLSVFKKLGFATYWLASQRIQQFMTSKSSSNFYDEVDFFMILPGGSFLYRIDRKDSDLLPFFETALNENKKNLIVLHTSGSHWDYSARYTKDFEVFKPVCQIKKKDYSSCSLDEMLNMYDNSILYTDNFIASVIEKLRNRNAILFYTSDHGESLGENGVFGHAGDNIEEQMNVPFFVWTSDKFKAANPEMYSNLSKNSNREISYKFLFHSILDCSSIKGDIVDEDLSLCRYKKR